MEFATDHVVARVLLTLLTIGNFFAPAFVDFNKTHATNPLWTAHARFHVVWQMTSYFGLGLVILGLLWIGGPTAYFQLWLAILLFAAVDIAFAVTVFSMPLYDGSVKDPNGVPPLGKVNMGGRTILLDANVTLISIFAVVLVVAALLSF